MTGWIAPAVLALIGCAEFSAKGDDAPSSPGGPPSQTSTDASFDTGSSATGTIPEATWYGLTLSFETFEGDIVEGSATVAVDLWSDQVPPALVCRHEVPVNDAVIEEIPVLDALEVDEVSGAGGLVGWWWLDLGEGVPDAPCPLWPARELWFGLGPYDTRLNPALDAAGLLGTDLFGLYLQEDPAARVYVVGVAGTADMFAGGYGPETDAPPPLPDGAYSAESLVLMSLLPPEEDQGG